ncbi:shikimate dehydrogenase [Rhodobacterales bacterium 52_120_T64]|nr:shikimate dehydrogenase [Rhodobacterales bacterium 52_120_T64]
MSNKVSPLAGVVGWPIKHSKSPALHGHWLERYGLDGEYRPIALSPDELETGLRKLSKRGFKGVNLTIPHKEAVLKFVDSITDSAALIGAANTIHFHADGTIGADNTDGYGFIQNLRQNAPMWDPKSGPALVVGAGGAARAVVWALLNEGAPVVRLANRTRIRAENLANHFGAKVEVVEWSEVSEAMDGAATIVNTTSLGMAGQPELRVHFDAALPEALVSDIVYTPLNTPFLEKAQARGLETVDGLGMLLHQAVPGFESWFGRKPEVDDELRQAVLNA